MYHWKDETNMGNGPEQESSFTSVRERANMTLNELRGMMTSGRSTSPNPETLVRNVQPRHLVYEDGGTGVSHGTGVLHVDGVNRSASLKLKELLSKQSASAVTLPEAGHIIRDDLHFDDPAEPTSTHTLPTAQEAGLMLQSHVNHSTQLEAENTYLKAELQSMKAKTLELLEENEHLHQELRNSVLQEILHEAPHKAGDQRNALTEEVFEEVTSKSSLDKWKTELARLHELHDAKSAQLESRLVSAKSEIARYERSIDTLKSQLRVQDSNVATREDGSLEGLMSDSQRALHNRTVARLQQERDELMEAVTSLRGKVREGGGREEEAYLQLKKSIELVEQAQLEQTEALVAKEQLQSQLENTQKRYHEHTTEMAEKMEVEKQIVRDENKVVVAQLNDKNTQKRFHEHTTEMTEKMEVEKQIVRDENKVVVAQLNEKIHEITEQAESTQHKLERVLRDRKAVAKELDETKSEIKSIRREATQMAHHQRSETTNCTLIRQQSLQEVGRLRAELDQTNKTIDQERSRLRSEKTELHRRLEQAEKELVNAKEECIHYTSQTQSLERELHFAKMNKESLEQCRKKDLDGLTQLSQQRESELNVVIDDLQQKHETAEGEMDAIVSRQNKLIVKLREECHTQTTQLAKLTHKYRNEVGGVRKDNDTLKQKLDRYVKRTDDCESLNAQHTTVQGKMRERLRAMDEHAQRQAQQVLDLLNKQGEMMRQRQNLAKEIQLLRSKLLSYPDTESFANNRPIAVSLAAIEDIMSASVEKGISFADLCKPPTLDADSLTV